MNRIKERRKELQMTQEELAEKANVSRQTIFTLETGKQENATLETMLAIAKALDSTVDVIFL